MQNQIRVIVVTHANRAFRLFDLYWKCERRSPGQAPQRVAVAPSQARCAPLAQNASELPALARKRHGQPARGTALSNRRRCGGHTHRADRVAARAIAWPGMAHRHHRTVRHLQRVPLGAEDSALRPSPRREVDALDHGAAAVGALDGRCGHSSVRRSRRLDRFQDHRAPRLGSRARGPQIPRAAIAPRRRRRAPAVAKSAYYCEESAVRRERLRMYFFR